MNITEEALTFDDVLLVPDYSEILPRQASLQTQLTREIKMNIPLVSAAMDTVTESELAIALAQVGGVGIIHKNMDSDLQAKNVRRVKKYESGVIQEPVTVEPYTSIQEVIDLTRQKNISGVPVVEGNDLVGIVTMLDIRFEEKDKYNQVAKRLTGKNIPQNANRYQYKRNVWGAFWSFWLPRAPPECPRSALVPIL